MIPACSPALAAELELKEPGGLGGCTLIIHKSRPDAWTEWFAANGVRLTAAPRIIELDSMFAVARAAERGLGVALVPLPLAGAWLRSGALVAPFERTLDTGDRYYFVHRPKDADDRDIALLARWTAAICEAHE